MENYINLDCESKYGKYRYEKRVVEYFGCDGQKVIKPAIYRLEKFIVDEWVEVEEFSNVDSMATYAKELSDAIIKSVPRRNKTFYEKGGILCSMKRREMLLIIAPCFIGYKNIMNWHESTNEIIVHTLYSVFSAENVHGTYGSITRWG